MAILLNRPAIGATALPTDGEQFKMKLVAPAPDMDIVPITATPLAWVLCE
jgi:hypothetical protein